MSFETTNQRGTNKAHKHKNIFAHKPHTSCQAPVFEGVMILGCFAAPEPGHFDIIESTMNHIPKYSRARCEAVCRLAKAWLKFGHAVEQ